jgi:hypothetical protein
MRFLSRRGALVALVWLGLVLFPLRQPLITVEEDPKGDKSVALHRDQKLSQLLPPLSAAVSGVVIGTKSIPGERLDTPLRFAVMNAQTLETLYSLEAPVSRFYDQQADALRFTFRSLKEMSDTPLLFTLEAPSLSTTEALRLRPAIEDPINNRTAYSILTTKPLGLALAQSVFSSTGEGDDIHYYYHRGGQVAGGINPYECVVDDTCLDQKNPGHFPIFYWFSALSQKMGLREFEPWLHFWQYVFLTFYVGIGALLFGVLYQRGQIALAFFASFLWLFNRWSLYVLHVRQIDFLALFFLVLSVVLLRRYWLSLLLFSVSLALKQMAVFLVPLYLIHVWHQGEAKNRFKRAVVATLVIAAVPLGSIAPYLFENPRSVFEGLLFSVTRNPTYEYAPQALDTLLHIHGAAGILPMGIVMIVVYSLALRQRLSLTVSSLLIFLTFISFNSALFSQYFIWFFPFVPLAASEALSARQTKETRPRSAA